MKKGIRNFSNIIWKQGARQMLTAAVIFFAFLSAFAGHAGTVTEEPEISVTEMHDAGEYRGRSVTGPDPEPVLVLVNFGGDESGNSFGIPGWDTVIKDRYTDYRDSGPGGTTIITAGSSGTYDYQGVRGGEIFFAEGDAVTVTWYNASDQTVTFVPKISFDDPDRRISGESGTWYDMSGVTVAGTETAQSLFRFGGSSAGTYGLVNVAVNYPDREVLVCDRIGLARTESDTQAPSVPGECVGRGPVRDACPALLGCMLRQHGCRGIQDLRRKWRENCSDTGHGTHADRAGRGDPLIHRGCL